MPDRTDLVFKALADPTRRDILNVLAGAGKALPITELSEHFDISRQGVTKHLRQLEQAGLVWLNKEGRERYCHPDPKPLQEIRNWLQAYEQFWSTKLDDLGKFLNS